MMYGNINLKIVKDSLSITKRKSQLVRHYPGTNISDVAPLGKPATLITCQLIATDDDERILIEQILHGEQEQDLTLSNYFYKRVVTGETGTTPNQEIWYIDAEFIALDPIPYSVVTGEALY